MSLFNRVVTALLVTAWAIASAVAQPLATGGGLPPQENYATGSATGATVLFTVPVGGYRSWSLQYTSAGSGNTVTCESSNDKSSWVAVMLRQLNSYALDPSTSRAVTTGELVGGSLDGRYFRCRVSTYGSGTVTAIARFLPEPPQWVYSQAVNVPISTVVGSVLARTGSNVAVVTSTRLSNTTTYTANTGWNSTTPAYLTFTGVCRSTNNTALIPQIDISVDENPSTKLQGILWLFNTAPGTIIADNATFTIAAADYANLAGNVEGFPFTLVNNQASGAAMSGISLTGTSYHAKCGTSGVLYGMVQVVNAYVPTSAEVMTIRVHSMQLD